jgi:uncharacterized protein (TIGR03067 family)
MEGEVTLRVDPDKRPRALDRVFTGGKLKGQVTRCVYGLDGDRLRVCFDAEGGEARPKGFGGSGTLVTLTCQRRKAGK